MSAFLTFFPLLADLISTVQFDSTGDFLASGDRAGRVVLFQRNYSKKTCEYKFYSEFQSHEPEFDYLKSLEINERINKLSWLPRTHNAHFILSTNDKTIKLWKIKERQVQSVLENNLTLSQRSTSGSNGLTLPKVISREKTVAATPKRIFSSAHAYNIHSISPSSDGEIFISSDDLRINLWNLDSSEIAFNVVDCKPPTIEDLTEVITSATFHPSHGNLFMYSTSRGSLRLCDLRDSALCDQSSLSFGINPGASNNGSNNGFFDEIISSVTDVKFSPSDPNQFLSRDYLNTHLWDMRMESGPLMTLSIHDHIRPRLCDLYENDSVFDKFECSFNYDGSSIISGSYNNYLKVSALTSEENCKKYSASSFDLIHADKSIFRNPSALKRTKSSVISTGPASNSASKSSLKKSSSWEDFTNLSSIDFNKKILHFSMHPRENSVAIASSSNLFIFSQI